MREHRMPTTSPRSVAELSNSKTKLYAEAVSIAERHVEWARQQHGEDHLAYGRAMAVLAKAYHSQGRYAEAEPLYQKALAITEKTLGADHPWRLGLPT
jgi:tetratricopeptide (TPR) repeat protein